MSTPTTRRRAGPWRRVVAWTAGLPLLCSAACQDSAPDRAILSATAILADADTVGFARADRPREFRFPEDHGPHPEYRHEWWYYTGNLRAADGRRFGFQLTFFRSAFRPDTDHVDSGRVGSDWATNQAYMAHFAVTDPDRGRFHAFERFDRGALGLAGARATPFRVHVGDWEAREVPGATEAFPPVRLRAAGGAVALDLVLEPRKPVVLQGDAGLSRKGPEQGNASYYYSLTRMAARGTVLLDGERTDVAGLAWLDREWGTSALGPDLAGWDWFSLQLDDQTELMAFRLRRQDGGVDSLSAGSFVSAAGEVTPLGADDVSLRSTGRWASPLGGVYPSGWRIQVPRVDLDVLVQPLLPDQEVALSFRYWEGAVSVTGRAAGRAVSGVGYAELTGYAEGAPPAPGRSVR
jgi:predicted secreted hydrolase